MVLDDVNINDCGGRILKPRSVEKTGLGRKFVPLIIDEFTNDAFEPLNIHTQWIVTFEL
jgi:hypothetical protein